MFYNSYIIVATTSFLTGLLAGYIIGSKSSRDEFIRVIIVATVMTVWAFRLIASTINPEIDVSVWEHIITGIIVGAFFNPTKGAIEMVAAKLPVLTKKNG